MANANFLKSQKFNIYKDIFEFSKKLYKKYKIPLNINLINQIDKTESEVVYQICLEALKSIVDMDINNIDELNEEIKNDNNFLEVIQI